MIDRIRKIIKEEVDLKLFLFRKELESYDSICEMEQDYFTLNEFDTNDVHEYRSAEYTVVKGNNKSWEFEDRCGNTIVLIYLESQNEIKTAYKLKNNRLIFNSDVFKKNDINNELKSCADSAILNTIYKILKLEVIPKILLTKKGSLIKFIPVSDSRKRVVGILLASLIKDFPELKVIDLSLINK